MLALDGDLALVVDWQLATVLRHGPHREVAAILQQPEGTIKGRIRLGLRKLADRLDTAGLGPPRPGAARRPRTQQDPR